MTRGSMRGPATGVGKGTARRGAGPGVDGPTPRGVARGGYGAAQREATPQGQRARRPCRHGPGSGPGGLMHRLKRLPGLSALVVLFCLAGVIRLALGIDGALAQDSNADPAAWSSPAQATAPRDGDAAGSGEGRPADARADAARGAAPGDERDVAAIVLELRRREAELAERSAQIEERLALLAAAEERVTRQIEALREAEAELDATMTLADGLAEADIERLVAMFEAMRAEQAAQVFAEMDPRFAAGFLGRLRPETAAGILGGLEPTQAYALSTILAGRNALVPTRPPSRTE